MKVMGELRYCLGISVGQNKADRTVEIKQKQYIPKLLDRYGVNNAKPVATLADRIVRLSKRME